nr:leucine zipper domain-containing protein [Stenotrophomonas maltophilia]
MNHHKNARLTPFSRELLVRRIVLEGLRAEEAAQTCDVSVRTTYTWLARFAAEGTERLQNRSSMSRSTLHATSLETMEDSKLRIQQGRLSAPSFFQLIPTQWSPAASPRCHKPPATPPATH